MDNEQIDHRAIELGKIIYDLMQQAYDMVDPSMVSFHSDDFTWYIPSGCMNNLHQYILSISHGESWTDLATNWQPLRVNEILVMRGYEYKVILSHVDYPFTQTARLHAEIIIP
jgi:hypothetical protein